MNSSTRLCLVASVPFVLSAILTGPARAADHLQCFKIKDDAAKVAYTADIDPSDPVFASVSPGCSIRVPAKLLCVDAAKSNVVPSPPGAPAGVSVQKFLCYKTKCDKLNAAASLTDQFGLHNITAKKAGLVCAPVAAESVSSTTMPCVDLDMDTYCTDVDCNDSDPAQNPGATEVCDALDNDCDMQTDESDPNVGQACATGQPGICATGTLVCQAGSLTCQQDQSSTSETCNGLDDNCDGDVDEGGVCLLSNGAVCNSGVECSSGFCVDGVCCNTNCGGLCQACTMLQKGSGADGDCGNIGSGLDPDNECAAAQNCDGAGGCF